LGTTLRWPIGLLQSIELDIRSARNTEIEFMNCTREEVTSITGVCSALNYRTSLSFV